MTIDTEIALDIIQPICDLFDVEVEADKDFLYIKTYDYKPAIISISCNSTYATVMEFVGYMILVYGERFRDLKLSPEQEKIIKRSFN